MTSVMSSPQLSLGDDKDCATMNGVKLPSSGKERRDKRSSKRTSLTLSTSFMDALGPSTSAEPAKKKSKRTSGSGGRRRSSDDDVLGGIYSTMNKSPMLAQPPSRSPTPPQAVSDSASSPAPDTRRARKPRIRFADDFGYPLVDVRLFEVEEGERVNVNNLSNDELRVLEAQMEKRALTRAQSTRSDHAEGERRGGWMPSLNSIETKTWKLVAVSGSPIREYATKSTEKMTEDQRQRSSLEAFYMPGRPCDRFDEPSLADSQPSQRHRVRAIPLDTLLSPARSPSPVRLPSPPVQANLSPRPVVSSASSPPVYAQVELPPATVSSSVASPSPQPTPIPVATPATPLKLPSNLQALLSGLKKTGILASDVKADAPPPSAHPADAAPAPHFAVSAPVPSIHPQATPSAVHPQATPLQLATTPTYTQEFSSSAFSPPVYPAATSSSSALSPPVYPVATSQHSYAQLSSSPIYHTPVSAPTFQILTNVDHPHHFPPEDGRQARGGRRGPFNGPVTTGYKQCHLFHSKDGCRYGIRCRYAHGDQPPAAASRGGWRSRSANTSASSS